MTLSSASLVGGSLMIFLGVAGMFWRFFMIRNDAPAESPLSTPPAAWFGWSMVAMGVGLLTTAVVNLPPTEIVNPAFWYIGGTAIGAAIATPGAITVISDQHRNRVAGEDVSGAERESPRSSRSIVIGLCLILVGFVGGAILLPTAVWLASG